MEQGSESLLSILSMRALLEVQGLHVVYRLPAGGDVPALGGVSFQLKAGEILGVLGESGSGKSTLAGALLQLLPPNASIPKGLVRFEGQDLLQMPRRELQKIRGARISRILQEPSMALHPMIRIREQIGDILAAHERRNVRDRREKALEILGKVFPENVPRIAESYPHQLSGGQQQRVLVAQAIACGPALVIADEPTASLDPSMQQGMLSLFQTLRAQLSLALILITHNPAILAGLADRVLVLYAGRVAEIGPAKKVLTSPQHPYTQGLLRCCLPAPIKASFPQKAKLTVIEGEPANLAQLPKGCAFEPRCMERMDVCMTREPGAVMLSDEHSVCCLKYEG